MPLFDPIVHLFKNSLLKILAQLLYAYHNGLMPHNSNSIGNLLFDNFEVILFVRNKKNSHKICFSHVGVDF